MFWRVRGRNQQITNGYKYHDKVKRGWRKGIWPVVGAALGAGLGYGASEMMGDSAIEGLNLPEFQEPEYYKEMQEILSGFGKEALAGEVPEYFAPLGEVGGEEFEGYLGRVLGDVKTGVTEQAARLGQRGGAPAEVLARETGDISSKMRYQDFLRAMSGRGNILNLGLGTLSDVRGTDLSYANLENQFALNRAGLEMQQAQAADAWSQQGAGMVMGGLLGGAQLGTSMWGDDQLAGAMSAGSMGSADPTGGFMGASPQGGYANYMDYAPDLYRSSRLTNPYGRIG